MYPIITDTHLKQDNIDLVIDIFKQFIDLIKSRGLKTAIHAGDFFTSRSSQSLSCLLASQKIFDLFEEARITLYIIPGNHDKTSLIAEESYLNVVCNNLKYVNLIQKETTVIQSDGIILHFLPYFREGIEYLSRLSNLLEDESFKQPKGVFKHVLITHASINGVKNNSVYNSWKS